MHEKAKSKYHSNSWHDLQGLTHSSSRWSEIRNSSKLLHGWIIVIKTLMCAPLEKLLWWMFFQKPERTTRSKNKQTRMHMRSTPRQNLRWAHELCALYIRTYIGYIIFFFCICSFLFDILTWLHTNRHTIVSLQLCRRINRFQEIGWKNRCERQRRTHVFILPWLPSPPSPPSSQSPPACILVCSFYSLAPV